MKTLKTILVTLLLVMTSSCKAQQTQFQQQNLSNMSSNIIGVWVNEEDPNWTIEFTTNGMYYWHYTGDNSDTFSYSISTISPQCGQEVKTGGIEDFYLSLIDNEDNEGYCYEILGVDDESLSLSSIGLGVKYFLFNKQ